MAKRLDERGGGKDAHPTEAGHGHRMPGYPQERTEDRRFDLVPRLDQRRNPISIFLAIGATQLLGSGFHRTVNQHRFPGADGMCEWRHGMDPSESVLFQGELTEEGRAETERVDRGTDVMAKSRLGELHRPGTAANRGGSFQNLDRTTGPGESDGRCQPVGSGTDYDRVITSLHP